MDDLEEYLGVERRTDDKTSQRMIGSRATETAAPLDGPDFYPTPDEAVHGLLSVEQFDDVIWEPACGDGAICRVLMHTGHSVIATDLNNFGFGTTGVDFLMEYKKQPNIVTNPPYKLAEEFARQACYLAEKKVAMLLRINWLAGIKRKALYEETPIARFWIFSKRLPRMHRVGYDGRKTTSMIDFMWVIWEHGHEGPPTVGWL